MGVLNITPDSFSDGGLYTTSSSIEHKCRQMVSDGADIIDVGGESSRPGSEPVEEEKEMERVIPVIQHLRRQFPETLISVDTCKSNVAYQALQNGADMVNDISALRFDEEMIDVITGFRCPVILMHMQGTPRNMQQAPSYSDVVQEVAAFLKERAMYVCNKGVPKDYILIDPGIGFGKTLTHNLQLLHHLGEITEVGYPVVLGASRKSFIGAIDNEKDPLKRVGGTLSANVWAYQHGVSLFRVHDVQENRQALRVMHQLQKIDDSLKRTTDKPSP